MRAFSPLLLVSAHALMAASGLAQTLGTGDMPRCFIWQAAPTGWDDDEFDERFMPMIRVDVASLSGSGAATAVKSAIADLKYQFAENSNFIDNHVCILLQNYGVSGSTQFNQDPVDAPDPWPAGGVHDAKRNPWLNSGAHAAKLWMTDFIEELSAGLDAVTPFRFHFDTEVPLCEYASLNDVALAIQVFDKDGVTNDDRWDDADWKIPVGDAGALTLKEHWDAARVVYTAWPADPHGILDIGVPPWNPVGSTKNNRAFFLWYQRILELAIEGAMKYAAYDQILEEWPLCRVSNYAATNIPQPLTVGTESVFGWQFNFTTVDSTVPDPADSYLTRELPLGRFAETNASYGHEVSGTYFIAPGNYRFGSMNAPVLYQVGDMHHTNNSVIIQRNIYLPHEDGCETVESGDCDAPVETQWEASMRVHRHWLESLQLSGEDAGDTGPWVTVPTQALYGHTLTEDDLSRQLCMLRAKNIPELLVWDDHNTGSAEDEWIAFMKVYERVYTPRPDLMWIAEGSLTSGSAFDLGRLQRTLFNGSDEPDVVSVDSSPVGDAEVTAVDVLFDNMTAHSGQNLRIILESQVVPDEPFGSPGVPPIFGRLYVWDPALEDWIELDCPDHADVSAVPDGSFGYYTPDYSGRRVFDFKDCRLRQIGETFNQITIRVVHSAQDPFKARHDLVQVLWSGEYSNCNCEEECEEDPDPEFLLRGADMDYNRVVNLTDAAAFDEAYFNESPSADLNRDGQVNETDLTLFAMRFGG